MQQSMLALVALLAVSIYSFGITREEIHKQRQAVGREVREMASSVAIEMLEIMSERAFDQAVVDSLTNGDDSDVELFVYYNDSTHFPTSTKNCEVFGGTDQCKTIEDFHNMGSPVTRRFIPDVDTTHAIRFNVWTEIEYVDENFDRYNDQTVRKRATVYVQDTWPNPNMMPFLPAPIEISRVYSYEYK